MVIAPIIIDLGVILMFLVALALCLLAAQIVKALFQKADSAFGWIPWLGGKITGELHTIEQRLVNALGSAVTSIEHRIAWCWHAAAELVIGTGRKIEDAYRLVYELGEHVAALPGHALSRVVHEVVHTVTVTKQIVTHADKTAQHAVARAVAIPADVLVPGDLTGLRERVREAEDELARLWSRVRGIAKPAAAGVAVGAVAWALAKLGATWVSCSNVNKVGKNVCGMNQDLLDALLAGSTLVAGSISIVELAKACQEITGACEDGVRFFVREAA